MFRKKLSKHFYVEEIQTISELRLGEITKADITRFTEFAEFRLRRINIPISLGEDMVLLSLFCILKGVGTKNGRRPKDRDVVDQPAFQNYVRGVINSKIDATRRERHKKHRHLEVPLDDAVEVATTQLNPAEEAEINDLKSEIFKRLQQRAPARLLPTIAAWEAVFASSDRIPAVNGKRKYVMEVRKLAQVIMKELRWQN